MLWGDKDIIHLNGISLNDFRHTFRFSVKVGPTNGSYDVINLALSLSSSWAPAGLYKLSSVVGRM